MNDFCERLCFTDRPARNSIKVKIGDPGILAGKILLAYCKKYSIDIDSIADDEFAAAIETMSLHASLDTTADHYYFSIDN